MTLPIQLTAGAPIVGQIETRIRALVEAHTLLAGARLPSVRRLAADLEVSTFTVAAAYDRLSAANYIRARGTAGYFVVEKQLDHVEAPSPPHERALDYHWLLRALQGHRGALHAGAGVLPASWFPEDAIQRSARAAIRKAGASLTEYPTTQGLRSLRDLLALKLIDLGIAAQPEQILLTNGASHALDLVVRALVAPGETVIVEDPGYPMLYAYLRQEGISFIRVPRLKDGLDIQALERALQASGAKLLIVNSMLHNPTGTSLSTSNAHKLLALAEQHDARILEDDLYCDFQQAPVPRIANLDQLSRVIYVSSFSKTVSANLRCGFVAAAPELIGLLQERKRMTCMATSELGERVVAEWLASGEFRRQTERFRQKLATKRPRVSARLAALGFEVPDIPSGGFFVWARSSAGLSLTSIAPVALAHGLVLAPGAFFSADPEFSGWARFNVAYCDSAEFEKKMRAVLADRAVSV